MSITEIREALHEVRDAVDVPAPDRVDLQRRVRAERRRRTTGRLLAVGAAAAAVVVVGTTLTGGVGRDHDGARRHDPSVSAHRATGSVPRTVFFVRDRRLTALDPRGGLHDLGLTSEGVVGWTSERVYAIDDDSRLVVRAVRYDGEGGRVPTFSPAPSPVVGPVQAAALSGDGRYLAWTDLDDVSHRYDLQAGREDLTVPGDASSGLVGVGADGLLLTGQQRLVLHGVKRTVDVPVEGDGYGAASGLAFGHVLVNDRDDRARLYDVRGASARLVDTLEGFGTLGPYAERVAVVADDRTRLRVWDGGSLVTPTGLDGTPDQVRWADETTLLVAEHGDGWAGLSVCDLDLACRRLPVDGEVSLNR